MLNEEIRVWFRDRTKKILTEEYFNTAWDVFQKFLEENISYYDFERAIYEMYNAHHMKWKDHIQKFTNIEIYMKAVYNTLIENVYNVREDDSSKLHQFYKDIHKVVPQDTLLNSVDIDTLTEKNQKHYVIIYRLRNRLTHNSLEKNIQLDEEDCLEYMTSMIVCYLDLAYEYRDEINRIYNTRQKASYLNIKQYADKVLADWSRYVSGFKYVDLQWSDDSSANKTMVQLANGNDRYVKLSGGAGSGKTTALMYLSSVLAGKIKAGSSQILPVYIPLARIIKEGKNMILTDTAHILNIKTDQVTDLLKDGDIFLLIDGLNEILDRFLRSDVDMAIDEIVSRYTKCHVIVTDRIIPMKNDKAKKMFLKELTLEEKLNFFRHNCNDKEIMELIENRASNNSTVFIDLNKPLLLRQFLEVTIQNREIPMDMTSEYLEMLMEREMNDKKDPNIRYMNYYLEAIGWYLSGKDSAKEGKILSLLGEVNQKMGFSVDTVQCLNLAIGMGILQREYDNSISFVNKGYQIYYAQNYVENNE
ncbi:MAG: hypothetical protein IKE77_05965 [Erysipelotrichaceae bacterium]|nr:hypothetical protein [Erysipelotrichaceae bacterium]